MFVAYITDSFDEEIRRILKDGGVGFMPSDTIYGLSGLAFNKQAIKKARILKDRSAHKPFIILVSQMAHLKKLGINLTQAELAKNYWPGSLSVIFEAKNSPSWLHLGTNSLAVRWPSNQALINLIDKTGPIVSTSANKAGREPINKISHAQKLFGDKLDFYVDGGDLTNHQPSTIVKVKNGKLEVVRQGGVEL